MSEELILTNARIVTADAVIEGSVVVRDGLIVELTPGPLRAAGAVDCAGDYLLPGLVELHTDNLE
jgi:alpha-D-ribose 1-methylphosphonate 5-triphosphate diphosphatase